MENKAETRSCCRLLAHKCSIDFKAVNQPLFRTERNLRLERAAEIEPLGLSAWPRLENSFIVLLLYVVKEFSLVMWSVGRGFHFKIKLLEMLKLAPISNVGEDAYFEFYFSKS